MILVDANLLLYASDSDSTHHQASKEWLTEVLNGDVRVGFPWQTLTAFLRIATNPRVYERPLSAAHAWRHVENWLSATPSWIPLPSVRHAEVLGGLVARYGIRANLVPDAVIGALSIEHGLIVHSADHDFARFSEVRWHNPLA